MRFLRTLIFPLVLAVSWLPAAEWKLALPGYRYAFPADHFGHPAFQTEWWYFTGNVKSPGGRVFGYELTFFRQGRKPPEADSSADGTWDTRELYLAHLALSDIDGNRFIHQERLNRHGPGIAGESRMEKQIWNGNWSVSLVSENVWRLVAVHPEFTLRLDLISEKAPVLHGDDGVHQKAEGAGRASHYVSLTRLRTSGEIVLEGEPVSVSGTSWMDHEFFTHSMAADQVGWDWFAIQLDDRSELMLYRLRRRDGSVEPLSGGTFVSPDGETTHLRLEDFSLVPMAEWKSPASGATYPISWKIRIPRFGLELKAIPRMQDQELRSERKIGPSYWEGAMRFEGTRHGTPVAGMGYLELTGYADVVNLSGAPVRGGMTR